MRLIVILAFALVTAFAQKEPVTLAQINGMWADPIFTIKDVLTAIDNVGLVIDFSEDNLASVLDAARKGNRPPNESARVVLRLLKDCRNCRDQFFAPLGPSELLASLLAKGSFYTVGDVRVRGTKGLPLSVDFIKDLKVKGAEPDLIAAIEEPLTMPIPAGFKPMRLDKAADFNPMATAGKLILSVEVDGVSDTVFLFRHNALWFKALKGGDPKDFGCTFTTFGPMSQSVQLSETVIKGPKKYKPAEVVSVPDSSGRPGVQVTISNADKRRQEYEMELKWTR